MMCLVEIANYVFVSLSEKLGDIPIPCLRVSGVIIVHVCCGWWNCQAILLHI